MASISSLLLLVAENGCLCLSQLITPLGSEPVKYPLVRALYPGTVPFRDTLDRPSDHSYRLSRLGGLSHPIGAKPVNYPLS